MMLFDLEDQPYIELNKLLKIKNLVNSGGEAKLRIRDGEASVNGQVETQVRRKLRIGDVVDFDGETVVVEGPGE